ncbi:nucleotide-binding protein [Streptomyces sp. RM72]|jgi:predicted nucleotide-binding protein|uniref:TIR domain-containing protein n=1 Tax=unclassified Streptomyces TaxID=2593676 RepID=UPI000EF60CC3|nr:MULTISPECIES: nucleotide-binding protein [unclassified Streptomyces]MBQ0884045.1 nucleotide-binding protein [Streptomyces sp. RM72]
MSGQRFHGNSFGQGSTNNFGGNQSAGNTDTTQTFGDNSPVHAAPPAPSTPPAQPYGDGWRRQAAAAPGDAERARSVFVVHGRDDQVRREMYELLRRLDLRPKEWEDLVRATGQASPFLGDVVAGAPAQAQAALVLLTPDDVVTLHPELRGRNEPDYETRPVCQPRPNVLIELGMVLMAYPERTLIVEVGGVRPIADIAGRNVIRFDGSETALGKVVERLKLAGCTVNDTGSDWRQTYPFKHLSAYHRRP